MATPRRGRPRKDPPPVKSPCFFQVFFPQLSSDRLSIPPAFLKHVEAAGARQASLTGPSRSTWKVDLAKDEDDDAGGGMAFAGGGWKEFVGDHNLAGGDFLVFRYDGKLRFRVSVLDQSACEKERVSSASPVAGASDPPENKSPARGRKKKKFTTSRCRKPKERSDLHLSEGKEEDNESSPKQEIPTIEGNVEAISSPPPPEKIAGPSNGRKPKKAQLDSAVSTTIRRSSRIKSVALGGEPAKPEERFDAPDGAKEPSEGSSEITEAKEKESHQSIPNKESIDALRVYPRKRKIADEDRSANVAPEKKKKAASSRRGEQKNQRVDSAPPTTRKSYKKKSAQSTKSDKGSSAEASLGSIEPKEEEEDPQGLRSRDESTKSTVSAAPVEAVRAPPKRIKVRDDGCLAHSMETRSLRKKAAASSTGGSSKRKKPPADSVPSAARKSSKSTPESPPERRRPHALADESNPALRTAKAFVSEKPFGVVVMRDTYCYPSFNLRLPKVFFGENLPKANTEMTLLDAMGRSWAVSYLFYDERASIRRGWRRFAIVNGVGAGDVCVFELVEENRMRVHIFKGD